MGDGWVRLGCLEMAGWLIRDGIDNEVGILLQIVQNFLKVQPPIGDFFLCIVVTKVTKPFCRYERFQPIMLRVEWIGSLFF